MTLITPISGAVSASQPAEYAVIIVIDGCRPEYLDLAPLPYITELAEHGMTYDRAWVGQVPTNTPVSHATLGTGVFPARHHVVGFKWKNPTTGDNFYPCTTENIRRGLLVETISDADVPSVFQLYKKTYPKRSTLAMSSVKPYAALTMGTAGADFILFTPSSKKAKTWGEEGIAKDQVRLFESLPDHEVPAAILEQINHKIRPYEQPGDFDTWVVDAFLTIFEQERPHFSMLNLPETDEMGHLCGGMNSPERMLPVIRNVDLQIGKIIKAFERAGVLERTLFVITADHGMVSNAQNVSVWSYSRAFLRPPDFPQLGVTTPFIWLRNPTRSRIVAERMGSLDSPGIDGIFFRNLNGEKVSYQKVSRESNEESFEKAWDYLLSTIACANSPDIFLRMKESSIIGCRYPLNSHGKHYQGTWISQHIPLIISGPGVTSGRHSDAPARFVDIPPTVLTLMGVVPMGMDGIVLADALINADSGYIRTQRNISVRLSRYQQALIRKSESDVEKVPIEHRGSVLGSPWFCNLFISTVFMVFCVGIMKWRMFAGRIKYIGLSILIFVFVAFQTIFIYLMFRMLEL